MASNTALHLFRGVPLRRCPLALLAAALPRRYASAFLESDERRPPATASATAGDAAAAAASIREATPSWPPDTLWKEHSMCRGWKDEDKNVLSYIQRITTLIQEILHSDRYTDGERLSEEDEKAVEQLLTYHPHSEDKIGCGIHYIMVDRHPQFRNSRCLFVVQTNGVCIDFSYKKCLRAFKRDKFPLDETFEAQIKDPFTSNVHMTCHYYEF